MQLNKAQQRLAQNMKEAHAREPHEIKDYPREDWVNDSNGGETDLNYWDWVVFRMTTENGEYPRSDISMKDQHLDLIQDIWENNMLPKEIVDSNPRMFRVLAYIQYRAEVLSAVRFSDQKENLAAWRLWVSKAAVVLSLGKSLDNTISRLMAYQILNKYRPEVVAPRSSKKDVVVDAESEVVDLTKTPEAEGEDLGGPKYQVPEFDDGTDNEAEAVELIREARGEDFFKGHSNNALVADHYLDWKRRVETFTALISGEDLMKPWGKWLTEADLDKFQDSEFCKLAWDPYGIMDDIDANGSEGSTAISLIKAAGKRNWFAKSTGDLGDAEEGTPYQRVDLKSWREWSVHVRSFLGKVSEGNQQTGWYEFLDKYASRQRSMYYIKEHAEAVLSVYEGNYSVTQ